MSALRGLMNGLCWGAATMYFFDPDRGRARRAKCRDQAVHWAHQGEDSLRTAARDLNHRLRGFFAEVAAGCDTRAVSDETLVARVRSKLGRVVRHPKAIEVSAVDGRVTLRGAILADEVQEAVHAVTRVHGAAAVENELEVKRDTGQDADWQGQGRPAACGMFGAAWTPAAQWVVGAAAGAVLLRTAARAMPFTLAAGLAFTAAVIATAPHETPGQSEPRRPLSARKGQTAARQGVGNGRRS